MQFGKKFNGSFTAQLVSIVPSNSPQRFKEVQIKLPARERVSQDQDLSKSLPPVRHAVKEVLVCVSRGPSPEKQLHQQIYHRISSSDEDEQERRTWLRVDVSGRMCPGKNLYTPDLHVCMTFTH